ncbi:hypothetical protein HBE96_06640 [Clostridium sp. P21]|uniref:Uncharacterized protein n=1 Tax=Clostridium muellerianum TaxID=2716538 RepID=A0A7Y0HMP3_9CLOT|nr:hypothetical protein [Clostridium muellerianum]NMM62370.1 hypothetical protein [Clostridium muellerianum]
MSVNYKAISQPNTTFNQPRQKEWIVFHSGDCGWQIKKQTSSFLEAQSEVKELLSNGGMYTSINRVMMCEVVPIDMVITPQV